MCKKVKGLFNDNNRCRSIRLSINIFFLTRPLFKFCIHRNIGITTHGACFVGRYKLLDANPPLVEKEGYAWCYTLEQLERHISSGAVKISGRAIPNEALVRV